MAGKNKASKFEGMTDDQILAKAEALKREFENTPERKRPKDFYIFGNKAVEINKARRAARKKARMSKENTFDTGLTTTWRVPEGMEQTRNRLAALIMQESGPRADAAPEYTLLGERLVASALWNYMDKYGLTTPELISGKGKYGGPGYLPSITDIQERPERSVYDWANDKFKRDMFVHDDTTFTHMTNAVRLASALVNRTLRPLTTATNFKHLAPDDEFNDMTKVDYDFGTTPVPTTKVLKLYVDPNMKMATRQDAKGGDTRRDVRAAKGAGDTEGPGVPTDAGRIQDRTEERGQATAQNYTNMSVHDKLKLADERLEKLKGTDKYDAFKERVDAMHAKYDPMITKLGQKLEDQGYSRDIAKDATWNYKNNRMGRGPIASKRIDEEYDTKYNSALVGNVSSAVSASGAVVAAHAKGVKAYNAVIESTAAKARGIVQGARDTLAQTVKQAGQKATAQAAQAASGNVARLTATVGSKMAQGNALAEAITHFGLTGKEAAENAKAATDYFKAAKAAQTELTGIKTGIAAAGRNARVAARNTGQQGIIQPALKQAKQVAEGAAKAAGRAELAAGAKTFVKSNAATSFAIGGVISAVKGATDLYGTIKGTKGEGLGTAVKDTFTTKQGWKNLGLGLVGALRDVGNSMTLGIIENGDRTREKMMDAKGGDAGRGSEAPVETSANAPAPQGGPRIVINPAVFKDKRDALCVAMNEAFRIVMEDTGFEPVSEPTEAQRRFFSDTAYADDELQMRRTILARICTFDTSVKDPTDEQLQESVEFLHSVLEAGYPQNEWEQALVQKLLDILSHVPTGRRGGTSEPEPSTGGGLETQGDVAGGIAGNVEREEERDLRAGGAVLENPKYDAQGVAAGPQQDADVLPTVEHQNENNLRAGGAVLADPRHDAEGAEFDAERRRKQQGV